VVAQPLIELPQHRESCAQREGDQDECAPAHLPIHQLRNQLSTNEQQVESSRAGTRHSGVDRDVHPRIRDVQMGGVRPASD
jgi:hypothetical protein